MGLAARHGNRIFACVDSSDTTAGLDDHRSTSFQMMSLVVGVCSGILTQMPTTIVGFDTFHTIPP